MAISGGNVHEILTLLSSALNEGRHDFHIFISATATGEKKEDDPLPFEDVKPKQTPSDGPSESSFTCIKPSEVITTGCTGLVRLAYTVADLFIL